MSGIALDTEQLSAHTDAEAIIKAEARFVRLLGNRSGSAVLKDDAGRVVWTLRRSMSLDASAEARETEQQIPQASDIRAAQGSG
ncbi:hypothetical protein MKK84_30840 [Methylobacterium sp. E-065]|uniref:hypothetical protein n=1 Tax=Methylobacterium sp. E-065 TaxID=2836583 RepID=UPI001FBAB3D6|nr:hypothetical protein [Methylobacterium sp. E-065]MCJ2021758.1 hypothetical protein [Methylobacterium sp. E-065]